MKKLLIIDGLNMFLRSWIVVPHMNKSGIPNGGTIGFIKSLQKLCRKFSPDEIAVIWDGEGGSQKKKAIDKNYKEGRAPIRFNRRYLDLTQEQQEMNKIIQQLRLYEYLNEMPVIQIAIDFVEADDVIAHIANSDKYSGWSKVIVSSDKDFFQLCDGETTVYRPVQDRIITEDSLLEEFGIHPKNFALARSIVGDKSDNLPGVGRVGLKTIKTRFGFLSESQAYEVEDIIDKCEQTEKKLTCHKNILDGKSLIEKNYQLMQLYDPSISLVNKEIIDYNIDNFEPFFNKMNIQKMLFQDGQGSLNLDYLWFTLKKVKREQAV
jgi:5'-3' exonuclease